MSSIVNGLVVSGCGQVQDIYQHDKQIIVRIHCFNQSAIGRGEEMVFVCRVMEPILEAKLIEFQQTLQQGKILQVKFSMHYVGTIGFQYCMANDDPDHLITIAAKLLAINEIEVLDITKVNSDLPAMFL